MRVLRTGPQDNEYWEAEDLSKHLNCTTEEARKIMDSYHKENRTGRYGAVEKALILDYVEQKQREQRERELRYQSELANVEKTAVLKEQVKTLKEQLSTLKEQTKYFQEQVGILKEQVGTIKEMSHSSDRRARIANLIAWFSLIVAFITLLLKLQ